MSEFYFYAYTIGSRWGADHGIRYPNLDAARRAAQAFAERGDCMQARVSASRSMGRGADFKIGTLFVERYTPAGFVPVSGEV